ncbi:uncharacterized protein L203_105793 [Cryptococcus depauperatus CBS 7841]|uniref:TPR-like protein n=1 Tax=Cryptococcus depauperatus CBS 7841 TaxID=1295531 RepID=A0AAJ8JY72_9TREE
MSFSRSLLKTSRLCLSAGIIPRAGVRFVPLVQTYATPSSTPPSSQNPAFTRAQDLLESGTRALEDGDLGQARELYKQSIEMKESSEGWHNLANCEYHLQNKSAAISAWERSIVLQPSPDAHTNLASAYIFDKPPKPALAIRHLTEALKLAPEDAEIAFNLAAILESTGNLEQALTLYRKAESGGIDRASQNLRNISAKIMAQKAKDIENEKQ